jgi:myo-inositol-1(or 4)-monophosphatase
VLSDHLTFLKEALQEVRKEVLTLSSLEERSKVVGRAYYGDESVLIDRVADEALLRKVREHYGEFTYISEESGIVKEGRGLPHILVDPLDGSTNAKRGISHYCTAVAIAEGPDFEDIVASGVIEHPSGQLIWGYEGEVYEGWRRMKPKGRDELLNSIIVFDPKVRTHSESIKGIEELMLRTKYPRMIGAAAWEVASLATGRVDAVLAFPGLLRTFDCLPSLFLLKQVGGKALYIGKRPRKLASEDRIRFVATLDEGLLDKIMDVLKVKGQPLF